MGSHRSSERHRPPNRRWVARPTLAVAVAGVALSLVVGCTGGSDDSRSADPDDGSIESPSAAPTIVLARPVDSSDPVGPAPDSPFAGTRRDCGISTPLSDGSALWFYCDTLRFDDDGSLEFFLNTSVARADAAAPLVMVDQPDRRGDLRPVLEPVPGYPPCTAGQGSFTWPTAALTVPAGERRDRVIVYFENVCVLPGQLEGHDVGVAEVVYDLDEPPGPNSPIVATVLEPRLFARADGWSPFGLAAVAHDGWIYVYRCPTGSGPCEVARVRPGDVAADEGYSYWTGDGWSEAVDEASPMDMPDSTEGTKPAVEWIEALDVFVMVNHPVTSTGEVIVRAARSPTGPWSAPAAFDLPGCDGFYPEICFAAEAHAQLSDGGTLGLTWFDPTVAPGSESPTRFAQVPFSVEPTTDD